MKLILTADGTKYELPTKEKPDLHSAVAKLQQDGYIWVSPTKVIFHGAVSSMEIVSEKGDQWTNHCLSSQRAAQLSLREFSSLCYSLDKQYGKKIETTISFSGKSLSAEYSNQVKFDVLRVERTPEKLVAVVLIDNIGEIVFDMSEVRNDQYRKAA